MTYLNGIGLVFWWQLFGYEGYKGPNFLKCYLEYVDIVYDKNIGWTVLKKGAS